MSDKVKSAIDVLVDALTTDADYRQSWVANIAMAIHDRHYEYLTVHQWRNACAELFIARLCAGRTKPASDTSAVESATLEDRVARIEARVDSIEWRAHVLGPLHTHKSTL